jgi:hypothetical protein
MLGAGCGNWLNWLNGKVADIGISINKDDLLPRVKQ